MSFNGDLYPNNAEAVMVAKGDMVDFDTQRQRLAIGSTNQILQVKSALPSWETVDLADTVLTTAGDILYENNTPELARLAKGSDTQVLTLASGLPTWATAGGVTASSTDTFTNKTVDGDGTGNIYSNMLNESAEASASDGADTASAGVNGTRMYGFETLPTTEKWYIITGIEWKNGASVSGNVMSGVDLVNANPPTVNNTQLVATSIPVAQAGTNAVQRTSQIVSMPIRGGSIIGMWFNQDNNTGVVRYGTVSSLNHQKVESYTSNPTVTNTAAWGAGTTQRYTKVYYRGFS